MWHGLKFSPEMYFPYWRCCCQCLFCHVFLLRLKLPTECRVLTQLLMHLLPCLAWHPLAVPPTSSVRSIESPQGVTQKLTAHSTRSSGTTSLKQTLWEHDSKQCSMHHYGREQGEKLAKWNSMARRPWTCRASARPGTQGIGIGMGIRILASCDAPAQDHGAPAMVASPEL